MVTMIWGHLNKYPGQGGACQSEGTIAAKGVCERDGGSGMAS